MTGIDGENENNGGYRIMGNLGNMGNMMKLMGAWNTFKRNHPKFPAFCSAVYQKGLQEDSIIEISVTTPEGEKMTTAGEALRGAQHCPRARHGGYRRPGGGPQRDYGDGKPGAL